MKTTINLVTLGNLKFPVNFKEIEAWQSKVFAVEHAQQVPAIQNSEGSNWQYTDAQLSALLQPSQNHNITIGIINAPLEGNFYLRRLGNNVIVLSLYETAEILKSDNFSIEAFIIRNLYEICLIYHEHGQKIPPSVYSVAHDEIRGCLFDMNANKADIVFSIDQPILCNLCKARIMQNQVPNGLVENTESELRKLRKALYFRIIEWVKENPYKALGVSIVSAIVVDLFANFFYDLLKYLLQ